MQNFLNVFGATVRAKRRERGLSQATLAKRTNLCERTITELEQGKTNAKLESVIPVSKELNISLDALIYPDTPKDGVSQSVVDFFAGKSEAEAQRYIALCRAADAFKEVQ